MTLSATARAEHMAEQVLIWARLHNHRVVTVDVVDAVMSRDKDTEQGKANVATVRRIIRKRAASELVRVIFTREERYWAIRERLHQMAHADVIALADSISDGGDDDPRGWDRELADAISAYRSNRPAPARVRGCQPVAVPLWKDPAPAPAVLAIEEQARALLVGEGLKEAEEGQAGFRFRTDYRAVCVRGILPEGTDWPLFTEEIRLRLERCGWSTESADGFGVKVSPPAVEEEPPAPAPAPAPDVDPYKALYASLAAADLDGVTYDVTASRDGTERDCPAQEGKRMALAVAIKHGDGARVEGTAELFAVDWRGVKNGPGEVVFTFRRRAAVPSVDVEAARDASGLSLGDLVEVSGRKVETEKGWDYVPAWYGHLRDVWASDGQIVARVDGPEGEPAAPLLSDLRPVRWHMRTVNGGTPERIPSLDALREINNAKGIFRKGVREMSESAGTARIEYRDVRGEVWLRPATSAEIAMEQKPEGERYAPGDRVIVRGTYYRPENRRTYVLDEYVGTVTNWTGSHFNVRAVEPDEDGTTYGVRPCRVRELRPVPPTVDDVADVPHDLYLSGELRHQGVTAERMRKIVKNLRGKRAPFYQDAEGAIVVENRRYVPQRPAGDPEPATDPIPREWSEKDVRRARGFAAKWRAETVHAEPPVPREPTDEALAACFAHTVKPIAAELYPLVRQELAGWDARP